MRELFNIKLLAALIAAGVLAFIAFLLLSAYSDEFRSGSDGRGHALSNSAIGFSGIVQLVDGVGGEARLLRTTASNDNDDLLVLVLDRMSSAKAKRS